LINWEDPGDEPPSAATSTQAMDAGRVEMLRVARARELDRLHDLADALAQTQAEAEKLAWAYTQAAERFDADLKALVRQDLAGHPVAIKPLAQQGQDLGRIRQLEQDLSLKNAQVAVQAEAVGRVESRVQELERALALAMAQARTQAWEQERAQAQARSPRARATAFLLLLRQLLLGGRQGLWDGLVRNLYLGMRVVEALAWMLPKADRARWKDESFSELEDLKQEGAPLLGDAFRIAARTPSLALVLWTGAWRRSPAARWLPRLKPVWIGVGTATATFWTGIAGIGQHPTEWQMRKLVAASLLTGVVALTGSFKGGRPRRRGRRRKP
jgi:hypothetical protein